MSTKKIQYNPNMISLIKSKSKKVNRPLLINQNSLKNQLISRVKNHKKNDNEKNKNEIIINNSARPTNAFTDEFNDSINYLSQLSKKHKNLNKTIKQPYQSTIPESQIIVDLELPNELKEVYPILPSSLPTSLPTSLPMSYNIDTQIPYGCLKNGLKPTYKQFTRRNLPSSPPILSERENKLNMIKQQYKGNGLVIAEAAAVVPVPVSAPAPAPALAPALNPLSVSDFELPNIIPSIPLELLNPIQSEPIPEPIPEPEPIPRPTLIKKTIRRKYTLGKSNIYRKVAVLIKNNETRKKIIIAQKELKKKSIHEIKKFLKGQFLLKSGSSAPNEVLRKMYESIMLTGHVTNNNNETILHNFMNNTIE